MTCPKCGDEQKDAEACRRCGLIIANWNPDAAGEMSIGEAQEAAALWAACLEAWDEGKRHDLFIEHCRKAGVLAYAAGRYRQSGDREGAAERLKQIRVLAEHTLAVMPRTPPPAKRKVDSVWIGIVVILLLLGSGYFVLETVAR